MSDDGRAGDARAGDAATDRAGAAPTGTAAVDPSAAAPDATGTGGGAGTGATTAPLLGVDVREGADNRWTAIETGFVEDPAGHVELAEQLVDELLERIRRDLWADRDELAPLWREDDVTTEQLRTVLRRYRDAYRRLRDVAGPPRAG